MAAPRCGMSSCAHGKSSPAAIRSWAWTMSSPVTSSVTGCSTWSRVFISRGRREGSGARRTPASHALLELAAQQAFGPDQQHHYDDEKGQGVLELDRDVRAAQALGDSQEEAAEDGARQAVEPAQDGAGESPEEGGEHEGGGEEGRGGEQ